MAYGYAKDQSSFLWIDFSIIVIVILASVLLWLSLLPLIEEVSPPVVWIMMFVLWHVFMNSEDLASDKSSSTLMKVTFLSSFLNVVTRSLRMSRCGLLLMKRNPNVYELEEHVATKVEVNPRIISTLKTAKSIWIMNPGANFETSVVGPLGILVALVRRQIGQGYSNSGRFYGRPSIRPFLSICFSLVIEIWPKRWWKGWERVCF